MLYGVILAGMGVMQNRVELTVMTGQSLYNGGQTAYNRSLGLVLSLGLT